MLAGDSVRLGTAAGWMHDDDDGVPQCEALHYSEGLRPPLKVRRGVTLTCSEEALDPSSHFHRGRHSAARTTKSKPKSNSLICGEKQK